MPVSIVSVCDNTFFLTHFKVIFFFWSIYVSCQKQYVYICFGSFYIFCSFYSVDLQSKFLYADLVNIDCFFISLLTLSYPLCTINICSLFSLTWGLYFYFIFIQYLTRAHIQLPLFLLGFYVSRLVIANLLMDPSYVSFHNLPLPDSCVGDESTQEHGIQDQSNVSKYTCRNFA